MFRTSKSLTGDNAGGVGKILDGLNNCTVVELHGGWFVVSDTGHFVVTDGQINLPDAAQRASLLAASVRQDLEQSFSLVPLVQPLVASGQEPIEADIWLAESAASVVPLDLLSRTLTEGPRCNFSNPVQLSG